jgi:hypothetical protein
MGRNGSRKSGDLVKILQATNTRAEAGEGTASVRLSGHKKDVLVASEQIKALAQDLVRSRACATPRR